MEGYLGFGLNMGATYIIGGGVSSKYNHGCSVPPKIKTVPAPTINHVLGRLYPQYCYWGSRGFAGYFALFRLMNAPAMVAIYSFSGFFLLANLRVMPAFMLIS